MSEKNKHIGQSFDTFLKKNGDYEAVTIKALQRTKAKLEAELDTLREKLTKAEAQIEAMRCCGNCVNNLIGREKEPCLSCGQTRCNSNWKPNPGVPV